MVDKEEGFLIVKKTCSVSGYKVYGGNINDENRSELVVFYVLSATPFCTLSAD